DFITGAAFERFLEVVSEASRHVPDEWKQEFGPDIPWREIAGIGNVLRHAYRTVAMRRLWLIYEADLNLSKRSSTPCSPRMTGIPETTRRRPDPPAVRAGLPAGMTLPGLTARRPPPAPSAAPCG